MKILELFGEMIGYGGQETFVFNVLKNMDCTGLSVDCMTVYSCTNEDFRNWIRQQGGEIYALNIVHRWSYYNDFLYQPVREFLKSHTYDLIHIHSSSIGALAVMAAAAYRTGCRRVIVHSHATGKENSFKHWAFRLVAGLSMAPHVKLYCACSRAAAEWKFAPPFAKRATIVKNGIYVERYSYDSARRAELRRSLGIPDAAFVIGNVGRFSYEKNHPHLISVFEAAAKKDPAALLLLVGDGQDMEKIKGMAAEKGLTDRIIFTGAVTNVQDYLQAMDLFIFPSLFEGFGIAAIEAITAGLPVVASDKVPRDINVGGRATFLSLQESSQVWADAVLAFRGQPRRDYSDVMREAGYDIRTVAAQVREIYLKLK